MTQICVASFALLTAIAAQAGEWTRFRGDNGAGVADDGALPTEIGPDKNVRWKTQIPMGKSSPVVTKDRIYLTGHENGRLFTLALDRKNGKLIWTREAPGHRGEKRHQLNDPAAPTPVSDGMNVYVFFAGYGLISYDAQRQGTMEEFRSGHLRISTAWGLLPCWRKANFS